MRQSHSDDIIIPSGAGIVFHPGSGWYFSRMEPAGDFEYADIQTADTNAIKVVVAASTGFVSSFSKQIVLTDVRVR